MYKVDAIGGHGMIIVEDHGNLVEWKKGTWQITWLCIYD